MKTPKQAKAPWKILTDLSAPSPFVNDEVLILRVDLHARTLELSRREYGYYVPEDEYENIKLTYSLTTLQSGPRYQGFLQGVLVTELLELIRGGYTIGYERNGRQVLHGVFSEAAQRADQLLFERIEWFNSSTTYRHVSATHWFKNDLSRQLKNGAKGEDMESFIERIRQEALAKRVVITGLETYVRDHYRRELYRIPFS